MEVRGGCKRGFGCKEYSFERGFEKRIILGLCGEYVGVMWSGYLGKSEQGKRGKEERMIARNMRMGEQVNRIYVCGF